MGGYVNGLAAEGLVLQNNAGDDLTVSSNGQFKFATPLQDGAAYSVTVKTQPGQPPPQTCEVTHGTGTIAGGNVTNVLVTCTTSSYRVGGTVSGLAGSGLVLQNNGTDDVSPDPDGGFIFATALADGSSYDVTVYHQPSSPTQTCVPTNATGTIESSDITNVLVTCTTNPYRVGGTVSGLAGSGLVLQNNGGDDLPLTANVPFTLSTPVLSGSPYSVTVKTHPNSPTQTCTVSNGTGTVGAGNITNVTVTCTTNPYRVGGTVSGLAGSGLVLQDNGGDDLPITANVPFTFSTPVLSGSPYSVTVKAHPNSPTQACTVSNGTGTVGGGPVTTVVIRCTTIPFSVGGTVKDLAGSGLSLTNNGGDVLGITANGRFTFRTPIASGASYSVAVKTQPSAPTQTCAVSNGTGVVASSDITGVYVSCCTPNCAGKCNVYDGCSQPCPDCPEGQTCYSNQCCKPNCSGRNCGDNGCGYSCGPCQPGLCIGGDCKQCRNGDTSCAGNTMRRCDNWSWNTVGTCAGPFAWSYSGDLPGWRNRVQFYEPRDLHQGWDNNFLYSQSNFGLEWSFNNAIPGKKCFKIYEDADKDTWNDNYICTPQNSSIQFSWSQAGPIAGLSCLNLNEPDDPDAWADNYLCWNAFCYPECDTGSRCENGQCVCEHSCPYGCCESAGACCLRCKPFNKSCTSPP